MIFKKHTGNWAEDMGNDVRGFLIFGLIAVFAIPLLLVVIAVLTGALLWG